MDILVIGGGPGGYTAAIRAALTGHPQVASIGLTEAEAASQGEIRVGKFPLLANGKAIAINDADSLPAT